MVFSSTNRHAIAFQRTQVGWTVQRVPNLARVGGDSYLSGISCPTIRFCIAVGATGDLAPGGSPLAAAAARWNGSKWSTQRLPLVRGARTSVLNSVSCVSSNDCAAVGAWSPSAKESAWYSGGAYYFTKTHVLIEHWGVAR
jgi:hypothetical protein